MSGYKPHYDPVGGTFVWYCRRVNGPQGAADLPEWLFDSLRGGTAETLTGGVRVRDYLSEADAMRAVAHVRGFTMTLPESMPADLSQKFKIVRAAMLGLSRRPRPSRSRMFFQYARVSLTFRRRFAPWTERRKVPGGFVFSGGFGYFAVMWSPPQWLLDLQIWPPKSLF